MKGSVGESAAFHKVELRRSSVQTAPCSTGRKALDAGCKPSPRQRLESGPMTSRGELPEPVQRYLTHALPSGQAVPRGVDLTMFGRIKVGVWLPFVAVQRCDGKSFVWRASVGLGPLRPLLVTDRYESGTGSMSGSLLGRWKLFEQADANVARSAAGRAALESVLRLARCSRVAASPGVWRATTTSSPSPTTPRSMSRCTCASPRTVGS